MTAESLGLTGQKCLTSLAVILTEASARKATDWASSLLYCVLAVWANPYSSCMIFWPMGWDLPYPIRTVYCISICIFTDQSEWLPNNQSACMILTNQDSAKWTNHTVQTWSLHLHKNRPIRDQGGNFLYSLPSVSMGALSASLGDCISLVCKLFTWIKFLLLLHHSLGTPVVLKLVADTCCRHLNLQQIQRKPRIDC